MANSQGLVQTNASNRTKGKHVHSYSTFDSSLSYRLANTHRFGDYNVSFVMEGVPKDVIRLNSKDSVDSLSLNAPFKGSIRKIKESFMVPNMAILPFAWDRIYAQPSNGDDVPQNANCVFLNFPETFSKFWQSGWTGVKNNVPGTAAASSTFGPWLTALLRILVLGEYIYSNGCLLNSLGYKGQGQIRLNIAASTAPANFVSYDRFFDAVVSQVFQNVDSVVVSIPNGGTMTFAGLDPQGVTTIPRSSFRSLLELFRENPVCSISTVRFGSAGSSGWLGQINGLKATVLGATPQFVLPLVGAVTDDVTALNPTTLNLSRILAYQLVCAHYFTNSSVDFIYSADLFRQYIYSLELAVFAGTFESSLVNYTWNGKQLPYDYLSGQMLSITTCYAAGGVSYNPSFAHLSSEIGGSNDQYLYRYAILAAVFGYRKSLRYGDYFTGSRPRPLAPVNTDVSVNNNMVSVVDITRNIQAQRFANAVMRSRSKIEEYVADMFGNGTPAPDYHNPFFLARTEEFIYGEDVQNTGDAQQNDALPNEYKHA